MRKVLGAVLSMGVFIGASVTQLFVVGSYSSFWEKVPPVLVCSPPMTCARPLRVPTTIVRRPVGIGAFAVHLFVAGSYICIVDKVAFGVAPVESRVRPPKT